MTQVALFDPYAHRRPAATLTYVTSTEHPRWKIVGEHSVIALAYKIFSGAVSRSAEAVSFPAVQATFEDLRMIVERFGVHVACKKEWDRFDGERNESVKWRNASDDAIATPALFKGELLPFQRAGVRFMLGARRGLLADDMGLGKTVQALAYMAYVAEWPVVIVAQPHMMSHWATKAEEFLKITTSGGPPLLQGEITYAVLRGAGKRRSLPRADVYIVHYLNLHAWAEQLSALQPRVVFFDECQELRHAGTRKHEACKAVAESARYVFGLSGTPIYNRGGEIFQVMSTLNRGALGTRNDFRQTWCEWNDIVKDPAALGQYLCDRNLMLRRRKDDVLTELPAKRRSIERIDADNKVFAELLEEAIETAKQAEMIANPFDRARMEAEAIAQTRKATGIAKAPAVVAFLNGLLDAGETVICFSHHHAVHDQIEDSLSHFKPVRITGRESMAQKDESKQAFIDGKTNLILISLRAATGIDGLQKRAKCVVFAELDWSPAIHRQAEDRAHRMGQHDSVLAYYLVADLGTDPVIMDTLSLKESQFLGLMHDKAETDEDRAEAEAVTRHHMQTVLARLRAA